MTFKGKMKRRKKKAGPEKHKLSLQDQMEDAAGLGSHVATKAQKKRRRAPEEEEELVSSKISQRILKEARLQQDEIDADEVGLPEPQIGRGALSVALQRLQAEGDSDDEDDDLLGGRPTAGWDDGASDYGDDDAEVEVTAADEAAMAAFMAPGAEGYQQRSLADVILDRLAQKQQQQGLRTVDEGPGEGDGEGDQDNEAGPLEDRVTEMYTRVGDLLSRYTTGGMPKAFKIVPNLKNWEEVLALTRPEEWSPHAHLAAARIFVSNLNARLAQRYLALVLLPAVRRDVKERRKLHPALFQALRRATFKPGAFFKGILLPLCATRTCTLREAVVLSSVLRRASFPVLHASAALLRLAGMDYCGTTSFFIRVLLDKKYALPRQVVDSLVSHFQRFESDSRPPPVVWHQSLLAFVQRYRLELSPAQHDTLRRLALTQHHYQVSPEIIRELDHAAAAAVTRSGTGGVVAMSVVVAASGKARKGGAVHGAGQRQGRQSNENVSNMPPVLLMEED